MLGNHRTSNIQKKPEGFTGGAESQDERKPNRKGRRAWRGRREELWVVERPTEGSD